MDATLRADCFDGVAPLLEIGKGGEDRAMADDRDREELVQPDPQVLAGDDDLPRQPTSQRDPFVPEPGPRPGERDAFRLMRWAWIPILIVVAIVIYAAIR